MDLPQLWACDFNSMHSSFIASGPVCRCVDLPDQGLRYAVPHSIGNSDTLPLQEAGQLPDGLTSG